MSTHTNHIDINEPTKYLYNAGTEKNDITGYYETFYRNYDASIGRFNGVDIAVNKYRSTSPYVYAFNDPVYWNDPLGDDAGLASDQFDCTVCSPSLSTYSDRWEIGGSYYAAAEDSYLTYQNNYGMGLHESVIAQMKASIEKQKEAYRKAQMNTFELAKSQGDFYLVSVGVNGKGDGNGNIIPGEEVYRIYVDRISATGEYLNSYNVDPDKLGQFLFFMGIGAERIHDLAVLGNKSADALVRNAAARGQAAGNTGLKTAYNKSVGGRVTAKIAFRGIAYLGVAVDIGYGFNHVVNGDNGAAIESFAMAGLGVVAMTNPAGIVLYGGVLLYQAMDCPECGSSKSDARIVESDNTSVNIQYKLPGN